MSRVATLTHAPAASAPSSTAKSAEPALPFTLQTLRAAIPAHCLVKDTWTSIFYMIRDFAFIAICYAIYPYINANNGAYNPYGVTKFLWWNVTGFFGWCNFVVGHDCGHRTFSPSVLVCDIMGHLTHTPILVPFHGWRISHRKHHENHNHVDNDHTWRPVTKSLYVHYEGIVKVIRFSYALLVLFPAYLLMDTPFTSGSHFNPWSRLFSEEERVQAAVSSAAVVGWLALLFSVFSVRTLLDGYFAPLFFFWCWIDLVTYLHHTSPSLHYYRDSAWSFLKGGLSTIDRSYGRVIDHLHHNIGTHMVHHLFFTLVPHYHLVEATEALKPILGEHYKFDDTPALQAFVQASNGCHYVDDEGVKVQYRGPSDLTAEDMQATKQKAQ